MDDGRRAKNDGPVLERSFHCLRPDRDCQHLHPSPQLPSPSPSEIDQCGNSSQHTARCTAKDATRIVVFSIISRVDGPPVEKYHVPEIVSCGNVSGRLITLRVPPDHLEQSMPVLSYRHPLFLRTPSHRTYRTAPTIATPPSPSPYTLDVIDVNSGRALATLTAALSPYQKGHAPAIEQRLGLRT